MRSWVPCYICSKCGKELTHNQMWSDSCITPCCGYVREGNKPIITTAKRWVVTNHGTWWKMWLDRKGHWERKESDSQVKK